MGRGSVKERLVEGGRFFGPCEDVRTKGGGG